MSTLFDPDDFQREEEKVVKFKAKISSCALCLFAHEITDICDDLVGYDCSISENSIKISDKEWRIPSTCPLRKVKYIIELEIGDK